MENQPTNNELSGMNVAPAMPKNRAMDTWIKLLLFVVILLLVGAGGIYVGKFLSERDSFTIAEEYLPNEQRGIEVDTSRFGAVGTLFLTLRPADKSEPSNIYTYDIATKTLKKESRLPSGSNITSTLSPDSSLFAFARHEAEGVMQIYIADEAKQTLERITNSAHRYKREPRWSPDGKSIVYVAQSQDADPHTPEGWLIYLTGLKGVEDFIDRGYSPVFSPTGEELLYLKNNGLYLYSLAERKTRLVYAAAEGQEIHSHMKLALSHSGSMLAWSDHHANKEEGLLTIFDVQWSPFELRTKKVLNQFAVYTAFSPDDKYLAIDVSTLNPYIDLLNLENFEAQKILDLSGYTPDYLWLTDWRTNK
ncbi:hypothetical protein A3D62_01600 [Candidatus Kaiserbacteria bacterium RIFCSPHIGHO2_02_FULL_49_11]|uniref:Dipeptidylpeptidase IV N-terminal domain-containing protein n=1 Tax=Candidatus Kaiserbacteria bacterium RIFCSPHIGHO2_02_FULL_49_11 TaxID=1798489 RepID=A0A1F6D1J2_9BACT|nr:MAG: hypothetical protein A3D62_01600 [Candidatus Kaiserbacteria bacterium RIFCSPHIGHO2_02_FULL_49_11]